MKNIQVYKTRKVTIKGLKTQYRWRVKANNGKIIGASTEGFFNKIDCINNAILLAEKIIEK